MIIFKMIAPQHIMTYNLATCTEYDIPVELTHDEVNDYIACIPDGAKASDIKNKLRESMYPIVGKFSDSEYQIIFTRGREDAVKSLSRIFADIFMSKSDPKFLMPYVVATQHIPATIAEIFESEVAMRRLKTSYIPTTLQSAWTCGDYLDRFMHGNVIFVYASLCTEYGWMFSESELAKLSDKCLNNAIPLILDISHVLTCSRVVFSLDPAKFPLLIGDFKYGFGPMGFGFIIISKQLINGWDLSEALASHFNDVIFPLVPLITYKSIMNSRINNIGRTEFDNRNWKLKERFILAIKQHKDFTIYSYDSTSVHKNAKFTIVLLLDPNSDFAAPGFISFFVVNYHDGNTRVIDGDLLQSSLMNNEPRIFLARCNPINSHIYTTTRHSYMRSLETDPALEETIVCSFSAELTVDDISVVVNNLVKIIRLL